MGVSSASSESAPNRPFVKHRSRPSVKSNKNRLAIIRYNYVPVEYVRGLNKRQIIGYLVEVPTVFPLLHPYALEQESLSCHLQTHLVTSRLHVITNRALSLKAGASIPAPVARKQSPFIRLKHDYALMYK